MKKSLSFNNDQGCQTGVRVSSGGKEWRQGSIADCQQLSWAIAVQWPGVIKTMPWL